MDKEKNRRFSGDLGRLSKSLVETIAVERLSVSSEDGRILQLEEENFRVNSANWKWSTNKQGITFLEHPQKIISEYADGVPEELIGQQLFNWLAAMGETGNVGKRMPADEEFNLFKKEDFGQIIYAGYRSTNGAFHNSGTLTYFWSSSVSGANAWTRYLRSSHSTVYRDPYDQAYGFSVRCLKS